MSHPTPSCSQIREKHPQKSSQASVALGLQLRKLARAATVLQGQTSTGEVEWEVVNACEPYIWKMQAGGAGGQGHSQLQIKFQACLGYLIP